MGWFGWDPIFARFHAIRDSYGNIAEMRPHIWQDVAFIIKDFSITGTGFGISSVLLCRIKRVAATGDNYAGGVAILDFDIHYQIDTIGSRQEAVR